MWAIAWWFARRWMRRRASHAIEGVTGGVAARRGRIGAVLGSVALVGVLAAGFVVWRKKSGKADDADYPSPARARPPEPTPFPAQPPRDAPPPPAAA
jgi:uncharacterized iron-regulated membrane protein